MEEKHKEKHKEALKSESQAKKLRDERRFHEAAEKFQEAASTWKELHKERDFLWCIANYHYFRGIGLVNDGKPQEAYFHFGSGKEFYRKLDIMKQVIFCEAHMYAAKGDIERINHNFMDSARFYFKACDLLTDISHHSRLKYEFEGFVSLGDGERRNGNYMEAMNYFRLAEATARVLKNYPDANWAKAHMYECQYYHEKNKGNLRQIIRILERIVYHYAKTEDQTGLLVSKGDLAKYRGLWSKIEKKFDDAKQCFNDAISWYQRTLESDPRSRHRHQFSISYASALAVGNEADIDLLINNDFSSASVKYDAASKKFASCGDEKSSSVYQNLSQLCKHLENGKLQEALPVLGKLSADFKLPSTPTSIREFISCTGLMISNHALNLVKEIAELDKGPAFEARIRELIRSFDNREIYGREIQLLPYSIEKLNLNRYEKVERRILKPKTDEIGIVFRDDTPVEIDILAERMEGKRRFLLIAECKHSPSKVFKTHELILLKKKAELVKVRYKKLAELCEEHQPIIEQKWFITTGSFGNNAVEFAQTNNIILAGITTLNSLLKRFRLPRIRIQE